MRNVTFLLLMFSWFSMSSQMVVEGDSLVGNEWIDYDQTYHKIKIHEDGIYRITYADLQSAGIDVTTLRGVDLQLYRNGKQVPIYTSRIGNFRESDFMEFYGFKNRGELDRFLYESEEDMLNPAYSIVTDTAAYFLSLSTDKTNDRLLEITNTLSGNLPQPEKFYMHSELQVYSDRHYKPTERGSDNIRYSTLVTAEGYALPIVNKRSVNVPIQNLSEDGEEAYFRTRFGVNSTPHLISLTFNGEEYETYNFANTYRVINDEFKLPIDELENSNQIVIQGNNGNGDRNLLSQVELRYPRTFDLENASEYRFPVANEGFRRYIELENFDHGEKVYMLDLSNNTRRELDVENGVVRINIEARNNDFDLVVYNPEAEGVIRSVGEMESITFTDLSNTDHDFVIVSSDKLYDDGSGINWVQSYADYRASEAGGGFNPVVVSAEEIYDHFGYGIDNHFISINNFSNYVKKAWPSLEYFFVIGKGIEYPDYRTKEQQEDVLTANYFVPAWGAPGSDNLLFAEKGRNYAIAPVGRIAATSAEEVELYLNKVQALEKNKDLPQTLEDKYWTKRMIHLSGGGNAGEQDIIRSYLKQMENIIVEEKFGADVTTFLKNSADPLQNATSTSIINLIDEGISLITFFGHSAVGTFDFSLEDPSKYNNSDRLPMIVSLGCYSGNIFVPGKSKGLSEAFVLEPEVGAIAFAASSGTAYISSQGVAGSNYYESLTDNFYGSSIGKAMRNTFLSLDNRTSIGYVTLLQQFTLHGDPALELIAHDGPDYVVDFETIKTDPDIISTSDPRYDISFDIVNLGSVVDSMISIAIEHVLPDGTVSDTFYIETMAPEARKNVTVTLLNQGTASIGQNSIRITVDSENNVEEIPSAAAEANNTIVNDAGGDQYFYYILDNAAKPVSPAEFGIFTLQDVTLIASNSNLFTTPQNYILQIDTSALYETPLEETIINAGGGLIEWKPTISFDRNTVYYWRITAEEENPVLGRIWNSSSFIYLPNSSEGWNQSHYFQYLADEDLGININEERNLQFGNITNIVEVINGIFNPEIFGYRVNLSTFATSIRPWNYQSQGIAITMLSDLTGSHVVNSGGDFGSISTTNGGGRRAFSFRTDTPEERKKVIDFLSGDNIPEGFYVTFFNILKSVEANSHFEEWESDRAIYGTTIYDLLKEQGAELTDILPERGTVPYAFSFRKNKGKIDEAVGENIFDSAKTYMEVNGKETSGVFKSSLIGPANNWDRVLWNLDLVEVQDSFSISILGVTSSGEEIILFENVKEFEFDISSVDSDIYPFLKIQYRNVDELSRSVPEMNFWRVLYQPKQEFTYGDLSTIEFRSDTIDQGNIFQFSSDVINLSEFSGDSLLVKYGITDSQNRTETFFKRISKVEKGSPININFERDTKGYSGSYQFSVELNPEKDQDELYLFNNLGLKDFFVRGDSRNPLLDVTFDGIHITDGEIVSPNPEILIKLNDENKFFILDDPSLFELKLDTGNINALLEIPMTSTELEFTPGSVGNNEAQLTYRPTLKGGDYTLYVQGKDGSNNFSGNTEYAINFRVVEENAVSNVFNYPNPFSTSTQFVFTLTGSVPDNMKIQVMTLSGKVVREITQEELGPIRVGINRTEFTWDGTDEYGDKLGNGVYLYRMVVKDADNGVYEKFDLGNNQIEIDKYFQEGFGKMVILR